jgi:hypothetical protein
MFEKCVSASRPVLRSCYDIILSDSLQWDSPPTVLVQGNVITSFNGATFDCKYC